MPTEVADERSELRADCARCVGLCCVVLPFARSADFAIDKPAGMPCPHLLADDRCGIHARLRAEGFPGCEAFDCFGAGQQLVQVTFVRRSWRDDPPVARDMRQGFPVMQAINEMRWYLTDPATHHLAPALDVEVLAARKRLRDLSEIDATALDQLDVPALRAEVGELLSRVSATVRHGLEGADLRRRDLSGQDMRTRSLCGADLRGALLLGTDLRGTDLRRTDLLGADLRGADLSGADLTSALFVTRPQLAAARGDATTRVPAALDRPDHWAQPDGRTPAAERR